MNIYDFTVKDKYGNDVSLSKYRGKTLLIINSATNCFFTPQYRALEALYEEMKDRDFEILDFPCNQFFSQSCDPLSEEASECLCKYNIKFEQFAMVDVNGENASPLFKYLEEKTKFQGFGFCKDSIKTNIAYNKIKQTVEDKSRDVRWNFTKFLVDKNGEVVARFEPPEPVELVRADVNRLLNGEALSSKGRFTRRAKDKRSKSGQRLLTQRIKSAAFFFVLTYVITFIFDLIILQRNGISVFSENLIPGMRDAANTSIEIKGNIANSNDSIFWGKLFSDQAMVRKQILLPFPSSVFLTFVFEMIFRRNSKQINKLCMGLEQASAGNFSYRLKVNEKDMFGRSFKDFNNMSYELSQTMKSLEKAVNDAEAANQAKSNFLSNMSHEIRTPLNAVLGMDEMILRESNEDNIRAYATDIKNAGRTLLSLINDILDFSKIEANKLEIIPVEYDLSSLINDIVNMSSERAKNKGLAINFHVDENMPHILLGDEIRVKQICTNIVTNAIKYTEHGTVDVSFERTEVEGENAIKFICKDTGQGISEEDLAKLVEPFARINEKKNRTIEGTGLGMSITTSLLQQMNSRLEVESTVDVGSTFSFVVKQPALDEEPIGNFEESYRKLVDSQERYVESFHASKAWILVVDDVEMNLTVAKSFLKKTLVNVETSTSGAEALIKTDEKKFDLIFLDHMMPDMDGIETLKAIRKQENANKETPVIVLTANAVSGAREKYLDAGFTDYLTKPIDSKKLEQIIQKYLPKDLIEKVEENEEEFFEQDNPMLEKIAQIDGIDVDEGITNSGGVDAYISVVENFANTAAQRGKAINEYFESNDIKNYTIQVHALKSSARLVGQMELSNLAKELEYAGNENNIELIKENTHKLLKKYDELAQKLCQLFARDDSLPMIDMDMLKDAITCLYEALTVFDMDMADSIMDTLEEYSMPADFEAIYDEIKLSMASVDRDKVMELIDNNKDCWR